MPGIGILLILTSKSFIKLVVACIPCKIHNRHRETRVPFGQTLKPSGPRDILTLKPSGPGDILEFDFLHIKKFPTSHKYEYNQVFYL
jgi:hypothetical protein